ncbi:MAG: acyl transferase [Bacteroidota bacterium]
MSLQISDIFNIHSEASFNHLAISQFGFQFSQNEFYRKWVQQLNINLNHVTKLSEIPFLPIEFFKTHQIVCAGIKNKEVEFTSSATGNGIPSKHLVINSDVYQISFLKGFELFFGSPADYVIIALLPNYLSRKGSSLVYMFNELIKRSNHQDSGFFLDNLDSLINVIKKYLHSTQKVLLLGVTYALLDLCELNISLSNNFIVMETGGMKGNRPEMLKEELHNYLKVKFRVEKIYSEYGMTELLSQAYCMGNLTFKPVPWMKFLIRDVNDPFCFLEKGRTGGINVVDLANVNSCSFIATMDLGRINENGELQLLGRYDNSDTRGCNLMAVN